MEQKASDLIGAAAGPCLVMDEDSIAAVQKKIADYAWAAQAFGMLEMRANGWIDRAIDIPDRGGQWRHWYV